MENGKGCLPFDDNCLEEERSDDSNYCLRTVTLNVRHAYNVFCAIGISRIIIIIIYINIFVIIGKIGTENVT